MLDQGKQRMREVLKQAKYQNLNHYGGALGAALEKDNKVANMPLIRVV